MVYQAASGPLILSDPIPARASASAKKPKQRPDWWCEMGNSVVSTHEIGDVEEIWRRFERAGIVSPAQSLDFTKAWIARFNVAPQDQLYVTGQARGKTVALLPLKKVRRFGVDVLTWFSGAHVGSNAPLIERELFSQLSVLERINVWRQMQRGLFGADLVYLHSIAAFDEDDAFAQLGSSLSEDNLYRAEFADWQACAASQHTRSRRKHDRQQGAKLGGMGKVEFFELSGGDEGVSEALEAMFAQKALRFKQWGVENPFSDPQVRGFYQDLMETGKELQGKLHVLKLDGEIIAVRYNLAHQKTMFSLISSMSSREELRPGSPGKQNVLRAMKSIFGAQYTVCDMGAGYSDEKRHWCNRTVALRTHYIPLSSRGEKLVRVHRAKTRVHKAIKDNAGVFSMLKSVRAFVSKGLKRN